MKVLMQKRRDERRRGQGFTLIEVCIVTIISGLLFLSVFEVYATYMKHVAYDKTYDNINALSLQINAFKAKKGRYPCPSDRTIGIGQPNFGIEVAAGAAKCDVTVAPYNLVAGKCYTTGVGLTATGTNGVGGVCMVACKHPGSNPPVPGGTDPPGTHACGDGTGSANNLILIGGVPIETLKAALQVNSVGRTSTDIMLDGWGNQLDYVVTYKLTNRNTWTFDHGAISVHDENGADTSGVANNAHFGVVSHGPDQKGAYTPNGQMHMICGFFNPQSYAPVAPALDTGPAGDDQNCAEDGTFISGIWNTARTATHYDDIVKFTNITTGGLWTEVPNSLDMYNVNAGRVNIGTPNIPLDSGGVENLNVALNVGDPTGGTNGNIKAANNVKAKSVCDKNESNCFDISAITKPVGAEVITCPTPGDVMVGVYTDGTGTHAKCQPPTFVQQATIPDQTCPAGQWLVGIASNGTIICKLP